MTQISGSSHVAATRRALSQFGALANTPPEVPPGVYPTPGRLQLGDGPVLEPPPPSCDSVAGHRQNNSPELAAFDPGEELPGVQHCL